jgi:O-antigen/teichoic acid export membrane protein
MFNVLYLKGDIILLSLFREQVEVGVYGAAYRVIDILAQTAMMIMGVMLPLLAHSWSRGQKVEFEKRYQQAFDAMMALAFPMMVGTIALADRMMLLVAGEDFLASGRPLRILAIAVFGVYLGAVFGHAAVAINKQRQVMWIYISTAIITLGGYLIFIPVYGMFGAAWMTVFSEIYTGALLFLAVRHYTKKHLEIRTFAKIIFSSLVMGAGLILFEDLNIFLLILMSIAIYGFFLFSLGGMSRETIKEIFSAK